MKGMDAVFGYSCSHRSDGHHRLPGELGLKLQPVAETIRDKGCSIIGYLD
jgi:hypothetical protein